MTLLEALATRLGKGRKENGCPPLVHESRGASFRACSSLTTAVGDELFCEGSGGFRGSDASASVVSEVVLGVKRKRGTVGPDTCRYR